MKCYLPSPQGIYNVDLSWKKMTKLTWIVCVFHSFLHTWKNDLFTTQEINTTIFVLAFSPRPLWASKANQKGGCLIFPFGIALHIPSLPFPTPICCKKKLIYDA